MKQVFFTSQGVRVEEVPRPTCQEGNVLVQTWYSVISPGTETLGVRNQNSALREEVSRKLELARRIKDKIAEIGMKDTVALIGRRLTHKDRSRNLEPVGYSLSGIIVEKGRLVKDLNVGDRVACAGSKIASHAEFVSVPRNLTVKVPDGVSQKEAAFITLGTIAMHGIRRAECQFGETVGILGLGLLGLLGTQIARNAGYRVIGMDIDESRVEMARTLGAHSALCVTGTEIEKLVSDYTKGRGLDAVIICAATSSSEPSALAARLSRKKARIVVVGNIGMELRREEMYQKELDFVMSTSYGPGRYDRAYEEQGLDYPVGYVRWTENRNMEEFLNMIAGKEVDVEKLISLEVAVDEAPKAYEAIIHHKPRPLGVMIKYVGSQQARMLEKPGARVIVRNRGNGARCAKGDINIAVIGAGSFSERIHLPNLKRIKGCRLKAIVCQHGERAAMLGERFNAEYVTTDYQEVLEDDGIDAVLIATRHNLHAPMTVQAAKAGKSVFVEKPMALNRKELEEIQRAVTEAGIKYSAGFNRRYSAFALEAKDLLRGRRRPYLISYRVNAGFILDSNWVHDPTEGGGRVIGECCHFFDLFNYLVESGVQGVDVRNMPSNGTTIVADDDIIATIRYLDGSLGTLIYTTCGNKSLGKERIEIFADGASVIIEDFRYAEFYEKKRKTVTLKREDKGHYNELVEFLNLVRGDPSSALNLEEAAAATAITFSIMEKIRGSDTSAERPTG